MSMHLVGPYLTTTSTKKKKNKITKSQQEELERGWRDRNKRLKEIQLPKETFEQYLEWVYGRGKKTKEEKKNRTESPPAVTNSAIGASAAEDKTPNYDSKSETPVIGTRIDSGFSNHGKIWVKGACTTKQTPTYTGTKIIGIGTMHKSNAVPIFSDEEAIDISRMRR
jgi:hypothetical protein